MSGSEGVTADIPTILAWMASTGQGATAAANHFGPGLDDTARRRLRTRIAVAATRARAAGSPAAPPIATPTPKPPAEPYTLEPGREELAALSAIEYLTAEIREIDSVIRTLYRDGRLDAAHRWVVSRRDCHEALTAAKVAAAGAVRIDRSPAALAAAISRDARVIELAAEQDRRRRLAEAQRARDL
jgi:hypothetical protein